MVADMTTSALLFLNVVYVAQLIGSCLHCLDVKYCMIGVVGDRLDIGCSDITV